VLSCCEIFLINLTVNGIYSLSLLHCSTVPELAADKSLSVEAAGMVDAHIQHVSM